MRASVAGLMAISVCALAGCAVPQNASQSASTHVYEEPHTGSLLGGGNTDDLGNGVNDPSMRSHQNTQGGK